jgi:site-specific DNA recombinase
MAAMCTNPFYRIDQLDEKIFNEVKKLYLDPEYFKEIIAEAPEEKDNSKAIREEIKRIDVQISNLMDLYAVGSLPMNVIQQKIDDLDAHKSALQSQLETEGNKKDRKKLLQRVEKTIRTIPQILEEGSFEDKRNLLEDLIERIVLDGDDIEIHWNF